MHWRLVLWVFAVVLALGSTAASAQGSATIGDWLLGLPPFVWVLLILGVLFAAMPNMMRKTMFSNESAGAAAIPEPAGRIDDQVDVFISYAREDRAIAQKLSQMLNEAGFSVWLDFDLVGGQRFRSEIERKLEAAACVLVVWSPHSVESDWVLDEAKEGLKRGILVPLAVSNCEPPMGFRDYHTIALTNVWRERDAILRAVRAVRTG